MPIFLLLILLLLTIWLDGNRTALFRISGGLVRKLEEKNDPIAEEAEKWIENRIQYTFILRTVSFIASSTFILIAYEHIIISNTFQLQQTESTCAFASLIVGLLLCKDYFGTVMLARKDITLLRASMPLVKLLRIIMLPYSFIIMGSSPQANEEEKQEERKVTAEDEILSLVEKDSEGTKGDYSIEDDEKRMIKGIFDLNDTVVREVMTPRVDIEGINADVRLADMKPFFSKTGFSRMPVFSESLDNILGIAMAKDFLDDARLKSLQSSSDILHKAIFVPETKNLDELLDDFRQTKNHFAVVVDEYGGTAGIVTIEDILEEIVGEIRDEYDTEEEDSNDFFRNEDGTILADARASVSDMNEELSLNLPEVEEFDTLGGYIYSIAGRIPLQDEVLELEDFVCKIIKADDRRIEKVLLNPMEKTTE